MESHSLCWIEAIDTRTLVRAVGVALSLALLGACNDKSNSGEPGAELAVASLNTCQQRIATWQQLQAAVTSSNVAERIAQLRSAAQKVGDDPEGCTANLIDGAISDELRKVLVIKIGNQEFPPGVVYICNALRERTKCAGRIADDTAQLGEAPDATAVLPATSEAQVVTSAEYTITSLQWYQALDQALLDNATAAALITPGAGGTLRLPTASEANVIFAIGKGPGGEFHKWVWLLR